MPPPSVLSSSAAVATAAGGDAGGSNRGNGSNGLRHALLGTHRRPSLLPSDVVSTMRNGSSGGGAQPETGGGWFVDFDLCGKKAKDILCAAVKQPNDYDKSIGELKVTTKRAMTTTATHTSHLMNSLFSFEHPLFSSDDNRPWVQ